MKRLIITTAFLYSTGLNAQPTIGLMLNSPGALDGYTLFAPNRSRTTYLIDNCGHEVNQWTSVYMPGNSVYFLPDGKLLRTGNTNNATFAVGGSGGAIEMFDWNGTLTWSFLYSDFNHCQHHDIHPLPNGNVLAIAWVRKTLAQALAAGRNPAFINQRMFTEEIIEIDPVADSIVWRWTVWDHSIQDYDSTQNNFGVIADHPELVDINYGTAAPDVYHANGLDYNAALDQIIISIHNYDEIWIIDHSTSTAEAASHTGGLYGKGGDLLYRWGNPEAYDAGTAADQQFFGQHNAQWIPDSLRFGGSVMVFNNGLGRVGTYSSIDIIEPPQDSTGFYHDASGLAYGPSAPVWSFTCNPPSAFYSPLISGVQALESGHYLICEGDNGIFSEIDSTGDTLWMYINPVDTAPRIQGQPPFNNSVFRCIKYAPDYSGFNGLLLAPGNLIEQNPLPDTCSLFTALYDINGNESTFDIFPNPVGDQLTLRSFDGKWKGVEIYTIAGRLEMKMDADSEEIRVLVSHLVSGMYYLKLSRNESFNVVKFIKQ